MCRVLNLLAVKDFRIGFLFLGMLLVVPLTKREVNQMLHDLVAKDPNQHRVHAGETQTATKA